MEEVPIRREYAHTYLAIFSIEDHTWEYSDQYATKAWVVPVVGEMKELQMSGIVLSERNSDKQIIKVIFFFLQ